MLQCIRKLASAAFIACAMCSLAFAQFKVEVDGTQVGPIYGNGDDVVIDVGVVSGVKTVRIYHSGTGLPDQNVVIGKVTINGSLGSSQTDRLDFWVSKSPSFPTNFALPILPDQIGAYSFGANPSDGLTITNPALERRTRVAISVVNSIRGTIRAGHLFRIQSGLPNFYPNVDESLQPQVTADLIATAPDQTWPSIGPLKAIEEVNISGRLRGNIIAEGDSSYVVDDTTTYSNIGRVVVRWRDNQNDISGDLDRMAFGGTYVNGDVVGGTIQANRGRITEVICAGRIGTKDADVAEVGDQSITGVISAGGWHG